MADVYKGNLLDTWVQEVLSDGAYPIKITIEINKNGVAEMDQAIDGRKRRNKFLYWMRKEFMSVTNIVPPISSKRNVKAISKLWNTPLEAMLRQVVYTGEVDYDSLSPEWKYSSLTAQAFRFALKDSFEAQTNAGLTTANPLSLEKVAISTIASNNHYKRALAVTAQEQKQ